jgi:hypothetical protein
MELPGTSIFCEELPVANMPSGVLFMWSKLSGFLSKITRKELTFFV